MTWSPNRAEPKTMKFIAAASLLNTQHSGVKAKTGWLEIRIMCPSGATHLPGPWTDVSVGYICSTINFKVPIKPVDLL